MGRRCMYYTIGGIIIVILIFYTQGAQSLACISIRRAWHSAHHSVESVLCVLRLRFPFRDPRLVIRGRVNGKRKTA